MKQSSVNMIISIAERGEGSTLSKLYSSHQVFTQFHCVGHGTAPSELLDIFGFGTGERDILISLACAYAADNLMYNLNHDLRSEVQARGIVFSMKLTGINNLMSAAIQGQTKQKGEEMPMERANDEHLILIAVNHGYTDMVMDTARQAGAKGGTVIRARWAGAEGISHFYGITVQEEKEILAIVAGGDTRKAIMEAVNSKHGLKSEAHCVVCSLGIEQTVRLG